jgi:hypothetical protein
MLFQPVLKVKRMGEGDTHACDGSYYIRLLAKMQAFPANLSSAFLCIFTPYLRPNSPAERAQPDPSKEDQVGGEHP